MDLSTLYLLILLNQHTGSVNFATVIVLIAGIFVSFFLLHKWAEWAINRENKND